MDSFISLFIFLQKSLFSIGPFFLLLGVLIFIHELGHFLAARYFGVRVEAFSLGFGPKLLKYKKGDTTYCLSILPLGGYVKMFGDNPMEEIPDSEKSKGFLYQKVHAKWLIAFAGPFMNLIFTVLAFFILALYGLPAWPPQLGDINSDTAAWQAGFRSGDTVLSVNEKPISYYQDLDKIIKNHINVPFSFHLTSSTGEFKSVQVTTSIKKNINPMEWRKSIGTIEGLSALSAGLRVGVIYNSPAYIAGLRTFDEIVKINDQTIRYWRELKKISQNINETSLSLTVKRKEEVQQFIVKTTVQHSKKAFLTSLGIEPSYLYIERVGASTPAQNAGFQKGDRLIAINGKNLESWQQLLDRIQFSSGKLLAISYQRQGSKKTVSVSPHSLFVEGNIKKRFMLGIVSGGVEVGPKNITRKRSSLKALIYSGQETGQWLSRITAGLVRLIQGTISLRTMGGPVAIGRVAHSSFHQGFQSFFLIMALISLNLFFLNLLPIPMLDGGHLLFFTIEACLKRPLSVKKLMLAQQLGLVFLLSFMGFAVFNDIYNWLKAW